jgi:hypothetical protein
MPEESLMEKFDFLRSIPNLIILAFFISGAIVLAWIGQLTLNDMSVWNKDIGTVFFGDRTGEAISLGIGMGVIHYFLIGIALLGAGTAVFVKERFLTEEPTLDIPKEWTKNHQKMQTNQKKAKIKQVKQPTKPKVKEETAAAQEERFFSGCLHHFGYLSSRPKDSPIPQECILCQRLGDCMVATVYVKKVNE